MSKQLSIPIRQTITLPDDWQACRTPQELSYWLIAELEDVITRLETVERMGPEVEDAKRKATEALEIARRVENGLGNLDARVVTLEAQMVTVYSDIVNHDTRLSTLETGVRGLESTVSGLQTQIDALSASVATVVTSIENTNVRIDNLGDEVSAINGAVNGLQSQIDAIGARVSATETAIENTNAALNSLGERVQILETSVFDGIAYELASLSNQISNHATQISDLDDRVTALEGAPAGGTIYRHMVRIRFSGYRYDVAPVITDDPVMEIQGKISGVMYVNIFNDSNTKLQQLAALASAIPENGGVQATGYIKYNNEDSAIVTGYPAINYTGTAIRVRGLPEEGALNIDFAFDNCVQYTPTGVPATPIAYDNNAAGSVDVKTFKLTETGGNKDFYDVCEELVAGGGGGGTQKYRHDISFTVNMPMAQSASRIISITYSFISEDPAPITTPASGTFYNASCISPAGATPGTYTPFGNVIVLDWEAAQVTVWIAHAPFTYNFTVDSLRDPFNRSQSSPDYIIDIVTPL